MSVLPRRLIIDWILFTVAVFSSGPVMPVVAVEDFWVVVFKLFMFSEFKFVPLTRVIPWLLS